MPVNFEAQLGRFCLTLNSILPLDHTPGKLMHEASDGPKKRGPDAIKVRGSYFLVYENKVVYKKKVFNLGGVTIMCSKSV